tara:strand:- start:215 stop:343 length:129 start_codon:yes stop_codon:yes gene_type:complete
MGRGGPYELEEAIETAKDIFTRSKRETVQQCAVREGECELFA